MKKKYLILLIVACFIAAIVSGVVFFRPRRPAPAQARRSSPAQTQRLPDGKEMTLAAVAYGQDVSINMDRSGVVSFTGSATSNGDPLAFCFTIPEVDMGYDPFTYGVVFDESGCWMSQGNERIGASIVGETHWLGFTFKGSPLARSITVDAFPRRGKTVILRLLDEDRKPVAEFTTPNPTPGPHPTWKSQPLPITKRIDDLAFTLTDLRTGIDNFDNYVEPGEFSHTRASFRITEKGRVTRDWAPVRITISDATGNVLSDDIPSPLGDRYDKKGEAAIDFVRMLCAGEVWKLGVEFARSPGSKFTDEELWTVRGVSIPDPRKIMWSDATAERMGKTIRLLGIGGPELLEWVPSLSSSGHWKAQVKARVSLPCDGFRLGLYAADDLGRMFIPITSGYTDVAGDDEREFSFDFYDLPDDVKALDLTFAIHESYYAEFLAMPVAR